MSQEADPFTIELNSQDFAAIDEQLDLDSDPFTIELTSQDLRSLDEVQDASTVPVINQQGGKYLIELRIV